MHIIKSKHKDIMFVQFYLTKEETENKEVQEKINNMKSPNTRIALFESGNNDYLKILERIIIAEVEKENGL